MTPVKTLRYYLTARDAEKLMLACFKRSLLQISEPKLYQAIDEISLDMLLGHSEREAVIKACESLTAKYSQLNKDYI